MKPKLSSWNVRGLNEEVDKHLRVYNMLKEWKANVVFRNYIEAHAFQSSA